MFQGCFNEASSVCSSLFPESFKKVPRVMQESFKGGFRKIDGCFNGVGFKGI